jgi:hypothetical protein
MNKKESGGQTLVLFALFLTAMLGGAGLVVDTGGAWSQGREQQKVADAAALAGATAETNGATRAEIIAAAVASAQSNGYAASEVTVNIPPTTGAYAPGGTQSGPLSTNDCSSPVRYPCWVEVVVSRPHTNAFAGIPPFNQPTWQVTERGVAVGGVANSVTNGASPIMFNYKAVTEHGSDPTIYCDPHPSKCAPNSSWPLDPEQFAWTTFCLSPVNCNVNSAEAKAIIEGGNFQTSIYMGMYLGPHNNGQKTAVCHALLDQYPNGGDLSVAINDDNGKLVGFWVWHLDTANSDCEGSGGEQLSGWFVEDISSTLPLTISAIGNSTQFGQYVVRLVE